MRRLKYKSKHYGKFQSGFREGIYNKARTKVRRIKSHLGQWQWKGTSKRKNTTNYRKYY